MAQLTSIGLLVVALFACAKPTSSQLATEQPALATVVPDAEEVQGKGPNSVDIDESELTVHVIDKQRVHLDCTNIPARQVTVEMDGVFTGRLEIPCSTMFRAPAKAFPVTKTLSYGPHSIRVTDTTTGHIATIEVVLPMLVVAVDENDEPSGWLDMGTHVISYIDDRSVSVATSRPGPFIRM